MTTLQVLAEVPKTLALVAEAAPKVQADIPLILKTLADLKQASADQKDPTALIVDLENLLTDANGGFAAAAALFGVSIPAPAPAPAPAAAQQAA